MTRRQRYLDALELIDQYHLQNDKVVFSERVLVTDWLAVQDDISVRLLNVLKLPTSYGEPPFKYMDEITGWEFIKIRNAGKLSWEELKQLRK